MISNVQSNFDCKLSTDSDLSIVKSDVSVVSEFSLLTDFDSSRSDAQISSAAQLSKDSRLLISTFISDVVSNFSLVSSFASISCTQPNSVVRLSAFSSINIIEEELRKLDLMTMSIVDLSENSSHWSLMTSQKSLRTSVCQRWQHLNWLAALSSSIFWLCCLIHFFQECFDCVLFWDNMWEFRSVLIHVKSTDTLILSSQSQAMLFNEV